MTCPYHESHHHPSRCPCERTMYHIIRMEPWTGGGLPNENVRLSFLVRLKPAHQRPSDNEHHVTWTSNFDFSNATTYKLIEARELIAAYGGQLHMVPVEAQTGWNPNAPTNPLRVTLLAYLRFRQTALSGADNGSLAVAHEIGALGRWIAWLDEVELARVGGAGVEEIPRR